MTLTEELRNSPAGQDFHPLRVGSIGIVMLKDRLQVLKELKEKDAELFKKQLEDAVDFCTKVWECKLGGLSIDIMSCNSCRAKFLAFYSAVLGIAEGRDFIKEVVGV